MNKRCLRMLAGFLVLVMLLTMIGGAMAEEPDLPKLDLLMLDVIEYSVAEWWESDSQKALLSVCAYIDIVLSENADWAKIAEEAVKNGKVYVAKKEILLSICFFGDEDLLWMYYTPDLKQAHVQILDIPAFMASSIMTRVRSDGTVTSYTEIERDDFNTTLEVVSWMFTEE